MEPQKKSAGAFIGIIIIIVILIIGGYYFFKKQNINFKTPKIEDNNWRDIKAIESDLNDIKSDINNISISDL